MEDFDNGIYQVRRLRDDDLDVYAFEELSYSEVELIMITKAILEKLGFVEKDSESGSNTFEYRTADLLVVYSTTLARVDILKAKEKIAEPNTFENEDGNMIEFDLSAKVFTFINYNIC